jgi:hypothetical protein
VNDIIIIERHKSIIQDFKSQLSKKFDIKDIEEATDYLGIEIKQNRIAEIFKIY